MTHEQYVSLETAKLLKQAGFDWECPYSYYQDNSFDKSLTGLCYNSEPIMYAPTQAVAQRWLREVKEMDVIVERYFDFRENGYTWDYEYLIFEIDGKYPYLKICERELFKDIFEEYEAALEAGLQKCLKLLIEKQ